LIDLHCHILPGIDDGAADMEDAVAMAEQAAGDGIEVVCATPHIRHDHDVPIAELDRRVAELNATVAGLGVRIARGGEVAETILGALGDDELRTVALGGHWVLVEPAPGPLGAGLLDAVGRLAERGLGAIVAHPERHAAPDIEQTLEAAVERGALVQATAAALAAGGDGARWLTRLAHDGLVHVLGSDSHSARFGRPVRLSDAYAALESGGADAERMRATAGAVLRGDKRP
jgi:protein-tyrosine phosphatase